MRRAFEDYKVIGFHVVIYDCYPRGGSQDCRGRLGCRTFSLTRDRYIDGLLLGPDGSVESGEGEDSAVESVSRGVE